MKITHIMHASILIETQGLRILSDPWWRGPCFGAQWWNYGRAHLAPLEQDVDYIYVSHGHHDHYHTGTLKTLNRNAKVLVSAHLDIAEGIRADGFEVIEVHRDREQDLGNGVRIRIMDTHGADTLMALTDGNETCLNLNDALHAAPREVQDRFCAKLSELYGRPDYVFCGYGIASHFPNCYQVPGKDYARTAVERQKHFNGQWSHIVNQLKPRYAFPFAADVVFFEKDLLWSNEPVHNGERPTQRYLADHPQGRTRVYDIAPGFVIEDGDVKEERLRGPLVLADLEREFAEEIERANRYPSVSDEQVDEVVKLLRENLERSRGYFASWPGDYRFGIALRNYAGAISVSKTGNNILIERADDAAALLPRCDVTLTTRASYLNWSLSRKYGNEIIFVGSGGIFAYKDAAAVGEGVHNELKRMITLQQESLPARPRPQPRWWRGLKDAIKKLIGREEVDLYNLKDWTVFKSG